jgi:predicted PolB exonuclease-like 3'-5' exonuclease
MDTRTYSELFLDIETIPSGKKISPMNMPYKGTATKQETIDKWYAEKAAEASEQEYRKRALDSMKGKILCIGYAFDKDEPAIIKGEEKEIISEFNDIIENIPITNQATLNIIGHNIKGFDAPWIFRKAIQYKFKALITFMSGYPRWNTLFTDKKMIDTMELWGYMDYKNFISMDDIATFLGIPGKKGMDGSQVFDFFKEGKLNDIFEYCKGDVVEVRSIYYRLIGLSCK